MRVKDVMSVDVPVIGATAALSEAADLLINSRASALPVTDGAGIVVGIVSEFDLIRHVMGGQVMGDNAMGEQVEDEGTSAPAPGAAWSPLADARSDLLAGSVQGVMTTQVVTVEEDEDLEVAARLMLKHRAKRIPVVSGGTIVGVVNRLDLMKALLARPVPGEPMPREAVDDDRLRREVEAAVGQLGVHRGGTFDVVTQHGVVHLWGEVFDEAGYRACRTAVAGIHGVRDVFNHMKVIPLRPRPALQRRM